MTSPIDNIHPFVLAAVALITFGATSAMWWNRAEKDIDSKAPSVRVDSLDNRLTAHLNASAQEWRINRMLLCRMPEIRPDSHCADFR